eukprot:4184-Eustigmatos_ZCMA.PRE.1
MQDIIDSVAFIRAHCKWPCRMTGLNLDKYMSDFFENESMARHTNWRALYMCFVVENRAHFDYPPQ